MTIVPLRKQTGFNQDFEFRCSCGKYQVFLFHQDSVIFNSEQRVIRKKSGFHLQLINSFIKSSLLRSLIPNLLLYQNTVTCRDQICVDTSYLSHVCHKKEVQCYRYSGRASHYLFIHFVNSTLLLYLLGSEALLPLGQLHTASIPTAPGQFRDGLLMCQLAHINHCYIVNSCSTYDCCQTNFR